MKMSSRIASAVVTGSSFMQAAEEPARKPNILFIPVDDLKPLLGCYGASQIKSPNIDKLAKRGTIFANAQCQMAVCGPSRASLMTGMYCDYTQVWDLKTKMRDRRPDILTIPQYFKQKGYVTTGLGKTFDSRCVDGKLDEPSWSIRYGSQGAITHSKGIKLKGYPGYQNPKTISLRKELTQQARQKGLSGTAEKNYLIQHGGIPPVECADVPDDAYYDGAVANGAIALLKKLSKDDKPFFLSVGFLKPHLPFIAPKKYWDLYDRNQIDLAAYRDMPIGAPEIGFQPGWELRGHYSVPKEGRLPDDLQRELIHGYYACVSYTDAQVGALMEALDETGLRDNTIVVLWGDHGWHLGDHSMWCKHSNFEQAVRSPLIFSAPGMKSVGRAASSPVGFVDIFPTLCELAGLPVPEQLQGTSLVPMLNDPSASVKYGELSQYRRTVEGQPMMGYTYRTERYRYTLWYSMVDGTLGNPDKVIERELYDYQQDPLETKNWVDNPELSEVVADLDGKLKAKLFEIVESAK